MLDLATIIGIMIGLGLIITGTLLSGDLKALWDPASLMITYGGAFGVTIAQFPVKDLLSTFRVTMNVLKYKTHAPLKLIKDMVRYAEIARRDGILALEGVVEEIDDPFLVKGLQLAVDGTDPELIQTMMNTELDYMASRHERGKKIFDALAFNSPAFGMIGTLIGLVGMLKNLDDPKSIGPNMAVALITTFYGAMGCYLFFTPMAKKLEIRSEEEVQVKEMIIKGVMAIQSGDNPRIVEQKLKIFLEPKARGGGGKE